MQHFHQGEYYAWQGDLKSAVTQFELASKANDGNFYQSSVVETRLRAVRRDVAEQEKKGFMQRGFSFEASSSQPADGLRIEATKAPRGPASLFDERGIPRLPSDSPR